MKFAAYGLSGLLAALGIIFLLAAGQANGVARVVIGIVCLAAAGTLVALLQLRPQSHTHHLKLDLSGDVSLENLTCRQCGGSLGEKSVRVAAGAVFIHCEYCGAQYQLEEAPKW